MPAVREALNPLTGAQYALACASAATLTIPTSAHHCLINVNSQAVRWTVDGTAPTSTKGVHVAAGGQISFMDSNIDYLPMMTALQIIQESATATLDVQYLT